MWVFNSETESMQLREVSYVPGLYKIFDEILVNAADNKQRDKNMDEVRVTVDREKGEISVRNNGRGIPIEIHEVRGRLKVSFSPTDNTTTERRHLHPRTHFRASAYIIQLQR